MLLQTPRCYLLMLGMNVGHKDLRSWIFLITVEQLACCSLHQSVTGPCSQPEGKSRCTGLLKNSDLDAATTELDDAREGVRAKGIGAKQELRKDSSKLARSSLTVGEEG